MEDAKGRTEDFEKYQQSQLNLYRQHRNQLLEQTDKYMLPDYPITDEKREQIKIYRQQLRDYFTRDDVVNWKFTFQNQLLPDFPELP